MKDMFAACSFFGLLLAAGSYQLARIINRRVGREICNPLLFATLCCCGVLLLTGTEYEVFYENGGRVLEFFLTPSTICLSSSLCSLTSGISKIANVKKCIITFLSG